MSECVYCRQGSITMGVDGPVCPDCLEEGYGLAALNAALRTPVKVMSIGEMAEDRIEELEAKLAKCEAQLLEVEASSQGWIDAAVEQQVRRKRAEARLLEVEADVAEQRDLRNHQCKLKLEAMARAEAAEAALASMQSDALAFVLFLDENYRHSFGDIAREKIRAFYARIQTGEKE